MKKVLSIALSVLCLLCAFSTAAFAEQESAPAPYIESRYAEFLMVYAGLYRTSSGFYHVEGSATTYDRDLLVEVTVTIEGCGSDGQYRPVDGFKWTSSGYSTAGSQATRDLLGGSYRAHTVAKCYRNGVLLETVDAYSSIVNVPY